MGFPVPLRKLITNKKNKLFNGYISSMIEKKRPYMNIKELKKLILIILMTEGYLI